MIPSGCLTWPKSQNPEGIMSTQPQRALLLRSIVSRFEQRVNEFLDYADSHPDATFSDLEAQARRLSRDCLAPALESVVQAHQASVEALVQCSCAGTPDYKGQQSRSQESYVGLIQWWRGYYYCAHCRKGRYPLDEALDIGPGAFSEGLQAGVSRLGAALPFKAAAESFSALSGVSISEREVERLTEGRGRALEAQLAEHQHSLLSGQAQPAPVEIPQGPGVWAVALDAAKVRFEDGWHDTKAGVVLWAQPKPEEDRGALAQKQSYVVEVGSLEEAGERLYAEAVRRGIEPGEELVVCLADGAPGNWGQFGLHFPNRVEVLDWYHAVEHLWSAGKGVFGEGSALALTWVEGRKAELWGGKIEEVLAALAHQAKQPKGKAAQDEIHYFETNRERMRYKEFRSKGYPIGSGTVESACKRVIGARVKQAGMCWSRPGAQAVLTLRAELLSGRWEEAWQMTKPLHKAA